MVKIKIIMPCSKKKEDNLEKSLSVPYTPTKPRTQHPKLKSMENIMKKSVPVVRRVKLKPEALREKIESIKDSRDYSFLFSVNEPVVRKSPAVDYTAANSSNKTPKDQRKPTTPLKYSEEVSKVDKFQRRRSPSMIFNDQRRAKYSAGASRQNIKISSQLGWRENGGNDNDVKQQDRVSGSRHERRGDWECYGRRHGWIKVDERRESHHERRRFPSMRFPDQRRLRYHHSKYSREASRQNISTSSQVGGRENEGSCHERREVRECYEGRHRIDQSRRMERKIDY